MTGNPITVVPTSPVAESLSTSNSVVNVDLSSSTLFTDSNLSNSLIVFNTSAGPMFVQLTDAQDPQTVANFFNYINSGAFANDIFHRNGTNEAPPLNVPVLQGGSFNFNASNNTLTPVTTNPSIPDEANANQSNVVGTIAMAQSTGPNTANSGFFFNLADNSQVLDLNSTSNPSGFAVFGQMATGADQRVLNTLAAIPIQNQSAVSSAFQAIPLQNYTGKNFPTDTTAANYALIQSIQAAQPRTDQLTFSIITPPDSTIATAAITNDQLTLTRVGPGTTSVTVQVTDTYGFTQQVQFQVTVS
jgi:peptidyl-prolyl cis-trans isomerase A (cyclophilin A)